MKRGIAFGWIAAALAYAGSTQAQTLYKWNNGTWGCIVPAPIMVNVYWETSLTNWDNDANAAYPASSGVGSPTFERIEAITRAWSESLAPTGVGEYGAAGGQGDPSVKGAIGMFPGIVLGTACPASIANPPANTKVAHDLVSGGPPACLQTALNALQYPMDNLVLNYVYPPQVVGGGDASLCTVNTAYHDWSGNIATTFLPTNSNCNDGLGQILESLTHEVQEAVTDVSPQSGLGYRSIVVYDGQEQEACDLCEGGGLGPPNQTRFTPFLSSLLGGAISNLWSNGRGVCYPGYDVPEPPLQALAQSCGRGQHMTATLAFNDATIPWDLSSSGNGTSTLYLQAAGTLPGEPWEVLWTAGGALRVPTADTIGFNWLNYEVEPYSFNPFNSNPNGPFNGGVPWLEIQVSGFDHDVSLSAGDGLTFTLASPRYGLETQATTTVGGGNQIALTVVPPPITPVPGWTIFGDTTTATGALLDNCGAFGTAPVEGDAVGAVTQSQAYDFDPQEIPILPDPVSIASAPSDPWGNVTLPVATNTAGTMEVVVETPAAASGETTYVNVHPRIDSISVSGSEITIVGGGFAQATNGVRTSVSVGSGWCGNPVVSTDLTTVTCSAPSVPAGQMANVVAWVDDVPSLPVTLCNRDRSGQLEACIQPSVVLVGPTGFEGVPTAISNGDGTYFGAEVQETTSGDTAFNAYAGLAGATPLRGDFDGDGRLDVALTAGTGWWTIPVAFARSQPTTTSFYFGTNQGITSGFTSFPDIAAEAGATPLAADFDGDGKTDVAVAGIGTTLPIAFSNGDGTFHATSTGWVGGPSFAAQSREAGAQRLAGDFNGDGYADVLLVGVSGWTGFEIAYGNGAGAFHSGVATVTTGATSFASWAAVAGAKALAGDFDGNGTTDVALLIPGWSTFPVAFSNGDGTFRGTDGGETSGDTGFGGYATDSGAVPMVEDMNDDGRADLLLAGGHGWWTIPVAFSNGDGTFHGTNGAMSSLGFTGFPQLASGANARPVAR